MDGSTFERVERESAETGSRRRLLGLIGSLSLAGVFTALDDGDGEAKRHGRNRGHHPGKHKNNRKGKRKRHGHGARVILRGHSVYLNNPANALHTIKIEGIETEYPGRCTLLGTIDLPPAQDALFDTGNHTLKLQINRHYYFQFINTPFKTPRVLAGISGSSDLCPTKSTAVFEESMGEGESVTITLEGQVFTVRRNTDKPDFKYWSLNFPTSL